MKKTLVFITLCVLGAFFMTACENEKTTQEYLREEKKAIERFMANRNFKVLSKYPEDHKFAADEFYRTSEGLYLQVVDSGNGRKVIPLKDEVQVRFEYTIDIKSYLGSNKDSLVYASYNPPMTFIYGNPGTYGKPSVSENYSCDGWAIPLNYVYEKAIVNLIVPSSIGMQYDNTYFVARYYKNLEYKKFY
ncbi:hypothetical protein M2138_000959 [Dysgonomonadaceae bacterium PH5-43]|nr:hypothetical protein [Dysgonomonadaceae bacterium PH5-43]